MRGAVAALALAAALGGCAYASDPETGDGVFRPTREDRILGGRTGNPSAVIATELAFARAAREDGQWTAFRAYATSDAVMPAPTIRPVADILRGRADPAEAIVWGPDLVWTSCDGAYALSTGPATYPDGSRGRFATIWQRQGNGEYRWVLDQGFELEEGYEAPELIGGYVAQCPEGRDPARRRNARPVPLPDPANGTAPDGTLAWQTRIAGDCARTFVVTARVEGGTREVFRRESPAPPAPEGREPATCAG